VKRSNPDARMDGVLVSKMALPGLEVIVGMNRDPQFGPVILFGIGGIMVEIFQDVSLRLLPLTKEEALTMIREIKGYRLISGYRGRPAVDEQALVDCLLAVARISVDYPEIVEIDLNPVFAYPNGIQVADVRMIVK
jgi:acyl-CoA synthetase (NDP forming)